MLHAGCFLLSITSYRARRSGGAFSNKRARVPALPSCQTRRSWGAFSLVEVLVVIVLIAVLSSLALTWYGSQREAMEKVTHQRNAQEIVSMGVYATLGGADFVIPDDKKATVQNLISGTVGKTGVWKDKMFRLTSLSPEALPGALAYVKFEDGLLLYDVKGGQL